MAKNKLRLQIITPTRSVLDSEVDSVVLRTAEGDMGVYYDHEPVVTLLSYGVLRYKVEGKTYNVTTMSGFAEVTAELENEIDFSRAQAAKERAEGRVSNADYDVARAQVALRKALVRLSLNK